MSENIDVLTVVEDVSSVVNLGSQNVWVLNGNLSVMWSFNANEWDAFGFINISNDGVKISCYTGEKGTCEIIDSTLLTLREDMINLFPF